MNSQLIVLFVSFCFAYGQVLNPNGCGVRPLIENNKIVGGIQAMPGDWGWQVSLTTNTRHFCGGVLINSEWVLTAAHCFSSLNPNPGSYVIDLGVHNRLNKETWVVSKKVSKIIVHSQFTNNPPRNDIALMKLESPVTFNNYILPACYNTGSEDFSGYTSYVTGWGTTLVGGSLLSLKYQVALPILTDTRCRARYGNMVSLTQHICAGESQQQMGPCQGDSGGPLVAKSNIDGKWYLIGIVSWGIDCGNGGVFTRTSSYRSWVETNINSN